MKSSSSWGGANQAAATKITAAAAVEVWVIGTPIAVKSAHSLLYTGPVFMMNL
jgi:hypothetical protein